MGKVFADKRGWHCVRQLPWREEETVAQADLEAYAARKGWEEVGE